MLEIILSLSVFAIVLLVWMVAKQPGDFCITRTGSVNALPSAVYAQVNDLRNWAAWSPWAKLDPDAKNVFEGPAAGVGAIMKWAGNNKVGEGNMEIIESCQDEFIRFRLEFLKPFKATNTAEFTFAYDGMQTNVTWTMLGSNNFIGKAISMIMNCDKMVGSQFEKGLSTLKSVVESEGA